MPMMASVRPPSAPSWKPAHNGEKIPVARTRSDEPQTRVLVFDQFEELFTSALVYELYGDDWQKQQEAFFAQVSDALADDPTLRVVVLMRKEYLAELERFAPRLPERLRQHIGHRLRYRLGGSAARRLGRGVRRRSEGGVRRRRGGGVDGGVDCALRRCNGRLRLGGGRNGRVGFGFVHGEIGWTHGRMQVAGQRRIVQGGRLYPERVRFPTPARGRNGFASTGGSTPSRSISRFASSGACSLSVLSK